MRELELKRERDLEASSMCLYTKIKKKKTLNLSHNHNKTVLIGASFSDFIMHVINREIVEHKEPVDLVCVFIAARLVLPHHLILISITGLAKTFKHSRRRLQCS